MNIINLNTGHIELQEGETLRLGGLMVHEDLAAGLRGKQILDGATKNLGLKAQLVLNLWNFDLLRDPALLGRAVNEAKNADIIVLAASGKHELSKAVRSWLETWLGAPADNPSALVLSLDSATDQSVVDSMLNYVRTLAVNAGVDFFPHMGPTPRSAWNWMLQCKEQIVAPTLMDGVLSLRGSAAVKG